MVAEHLVPDPGLMEQFPQEVQMASMRLQSRVVELEKEALTKNGVIENLRKLISERNPQNLIESLGLQSVERIQRQGKRL